jgi:hypothetical protein
VCRPRSKPRFTMDDPAFPDSHYTTTTTTTTTTTVQSPPLTIDKAYLMSLPGILRIIQIAAGLIYWILLAACCCYLGFPLSIALISWIVTIFFFIIFLLQLNQRVTAVNWVLTELLNDLITAVFQFIAACFVAARAARFSYAYSHGCMAFAAVLGFGILIAYCLSVFLNGRIFMAGGGLNRLMGNSGGGATTNTTVTTNEYTTDKEPGTEPQ